jgi:hypothetical protein
MLPQAEGIEGSIFIIRGSRVMLSTHLAALYNVEPRALVQAVKRNRERFPGDFMFQLTAGEWENLKSQIVISSWGGSRRAAPYAFTEQGIAMLSSVLKSRRAIRVNIEIMRAYLSNDGMYAYFKGERQGFCDACFTAKYPVHFEDEGHTRQLHLFDALNR